MGSIEMKILIKGAGDLATGIASRLYGAGHQIMMTDIAVPLTVRRRRGDYGTGRYPCDR